MDLCLGRSGILIDNVEVEGSLDVTVDVNKSIVGTDLLNLGAVNNNLLAINVIVVLSLQSIGNLNVVDRTEQLAVFTDLSGDANALAVEGSLKSLGILAELFLFESALTQCLFVHFLIGGSGDDSQTLREEVIVGVAVLYGHDVVLISQIDNVLFQYNFHLFFLL